MPPTMSRISRKDNQKGEIMRYKNIEFLYSETNEKFELVKWEGETNYVIAFFDMNKEGYDMRTVGDRFFKYHDAWFVGKRALAFLNDMFDVVSEWLERED